MAKYDTQRAPCANATAQGELGAGMAPFKGGDQGRVTGQKAGHIRPCHPHSQDFESKVTAGHGQHNKVCVFTTLPSVPPGWRASSGQGCVAGRPIQKLLRGLLLESERWQGDGGGGVSEKERERLWLVTECEEVPERCPGKGKKIQFGHRKLSCPADELRVSLGQETLLPCCLKALSLLPLGTSLPSLLPPSFQLGWVSSYGGGGSRRTLHSRGPSPAGRPPPPNGGNHPHASCSSVQMPRPLRLVSVPFTCSAHPTAQPGTRCLLSGVLLAS